MMIKTSLLAAILLGTVPIAKSEMFYPNPKRSIAFFLGQATIRDLAANGSDGVAPTNTMIIGNDGNLYGATVSGGNGGFGTFYKVTATGNHKNPTISYIVLHHFGDGSVTNDGGNCHGKLAKDNSGYIYGTCDNGGSSGAYGVVYRINTSNGAVTILHSFNVNGSEGTYPEGVVRDPSSGNLYGIASQGGSASCGTVFKLTPSGSSYSYSILHDFDCNDGEQPKSLLLATDGNLYGTTVLGGVNNDGIIWRYNLGNNSFSKIADSPNGGIPISNLVQIPTTFTSGNKLEFWGTAWGGTYGLGSVYKVSETSNGSGSFNYSVMHSFNNGTDEGYEPGELIFSTNLSNYANYDDAYGGLYGTLPDGGISGAGSLFRIDLSGNFWEFPNEGAWMGNSPNGNPWGLVEGSISGTPTLFGSSLGGGANSNGFLWEVWVQP